MHVLAAEGGPINAVFGPFEDRTLWLVLGISLVALLFAYYLVREVLAAPEVTRVPRTARTLRGVAAIRELELKRAHIDASLAELRVINAEVRQQLDRRHG